jgi:glycosyltransferase involved in cell wall biosynthesis
MHTLSVVLSTRNRAASLARTLVSIKGLASEIIVVDNESTDETAVVAKKFGAKVYKKTNNPALNINKNFGIGKATSDWILYLDDDEVIPEDLAREIKAITAQDISDGPLAYWIPRKNMIFGKWIEHGIWWPDPQLRLFKKGKGKYEAKHVHEHLTVVGPQGTLRNAFVHYNYDSIDQFLFKMQAIYTDSEVKKYESAGYQVRWFDAVRFPVSDFIKLYFAQLGYKDGLHGLVLAILQAFYSFIVFAKLWEKAQFVQQDIAFADIQQEMDRMGREVTYWRFTEQIRRTKDPLTRLILKIRRKGMRV